MEPMVDPANFRLSYYPVQHLDLHVFFKKAQASVWFVEEVDLSKDGPHWNLLTHGEKKLLKTVLSFFTVSDGLVSQNVLQRFCAEVTCQEALAFYAFQGAAEYVHAEMYSLLVDTLVKDQAEKLSMFDGAKNSKTIALKTDWMRRWIGSESASFAERLIAFAVIEGVFFSGSFAVVFWLKKRGLFPGLSFSNELISRDEGMHCDFACLMYNKYIEKKLSNRKIREIVGEAVEIEKSFFAEAIPEKLAGMNKDLMGEYIEYISDRLLVELDCEKMYFAVNPFDFMENISLEGKTNFFEKRVGEYQKANVVNGLDGSFTTKAEF